MTKNFALLVLACAALAPGQTALPTPAEHFGFPPGADSRLLTWDALLDYYDAIAQRSSRVRIEELGRSTEGRRFVALIVSDRSEADLASIRGRQAALLRGELAEPEVAGLALGGHPTVLYIQGGLHSTEVAAPLLFPGLIHRLATSQDPGVAEILRQVVLVIVPCANPDGLDLVAAWYGKTLGSPAEGSAPPTLYQTYAGHDNNRDWFMLSLQETRLVSRLLYERWFPNIVLDIHQMGGKGARMFVPPYTDPLNPNLLPLQVRWTDLFGTLMATETTRRQLTGVAHGAIFDNWWHGGARGVPARHNMVGLLTETAGARLASPVVLRADEITSLGRGLPDASLRGRHVEPWAGGTWNLETILAYQSATTWAVIEGARDFRSRLIEDAHRMARTSVRLGGERAPFGFVIPADEPHGSAVRRLVSNLLRTGVTVHRTVAPMTIEGEDFPRHSVVLRSDQAFRSHLVDLLGVQKYPELRDSPKGEILRPYDAAGWTLPLQFGIACRALAEPLPADAPLEVVTKVEDRLRWSGPSAAQRAYLSAADNDHFTLVQRLLARGIEVRRSGDGFVVVASRSDIEASAAGLVLALRAIEAPPPGPRLRRARVGLLEPWPASMDAGWTRLVLEEHGVDLTRWTFSEARLEERLATLDVLILPDVGSERLDEGSKELPPEFRGGLAGAGAAAIAAFVAKGGTLLAFDDAGAWAASALALPLVFAPPTPPTPGDELSCPGSLLRAQRVDANRADRLLAGLPTDLTVYVESPKVITSTSAAVEPLLVYPANDILASGWLRGGGALSGATLMARVRVGAGAVVLYAFRPQHRSQTLGTFRTVLHAAVVDVVP